MLGALPIGDSQNQKLLICVGRIFRAGWFVYKGHKVLFPSVQTGAFILLCALQT